MTKLVIVESPAKAKTISRFLGSDYIVEASYGHVRDLPGKAEEIPEKVKKEKWARLGVNVNKKFEPLYVVPNDKKKHVDRLKKALKKSDTLLLATDEDREGESIVWHLLEVLKPDPEKVDIQRIAFHEITPEAIRHAVENPRSVDENLVRAQEARRVLDRLYGYSLSPVLWRKVQSGLSAGRVQSVAVKMCVEREKERAVFRKAEYWDLAADLTDNKATFQATLSTIDGNKVASGRDFEATTGRLLPKSKAYLLEGAEAKKLATALQKEEWSVAKLEQKPGTQRPAPPFITSTLQQEANRKLGFGASRTMRLAQELYEGVDLGGDDREGVITYMRTDSVTLSNRALNEAAKVIEQNYGKDYTQRRMYKSKSANAQEAHEAIRPTVLTRKPDDIKSHLSPAQYKLYSLIWKRTLASQMADAKIRRTQLEIATQAEGKKLTFSASGKEILFPGYLRAYVEGSDDPAAELGDKENILPTLAEGDALNAKDVDPRYHETAPPARFTEASLVKKLEEEGIGRPSTYASIISTIQDRGYVFKKGNALVPTFTAYAVTDLLESYFDDLVDYGFTSHLEDELDQISRGESDWIDKLDKFYHGSNSEPGLERRIEEQGPSIEPPVIPVTRTEDVKEADAKKHKPIIVKIGRYGPYITKAETNGDTNGTAASVPDDVPPADFTLEQAHELIAKKEAGPREIGTDPDSGQPIYVKSGRFGPYIEIALPEDAPKSAKPRRASLPNGMDAESEIPLQDALKWLSLPRELGKHPETGEVIEANNGRYGPYVRHEKDYRSLEDGDDVYEVTFERAMELLSQPKKSRRQAAAKALREFPAAGEGKPGLKVMSGRYGPYVTDGKVNATLPKSEDAGNLTYERALELVKKKAESGGKGGRKKATGGRSGKKTATKTAAKKTTAKKSVAKKPAAKKSAPKK